MRFITSLHFRDTAKNLHLYKYNQINQPHYPPPHTNIKESQRWQKYLCPWAWAMITGSPLFDKRVWRNTTLALFWSCESATVLTLAAYSWYAASNVRQGFTLSSSRRPSQESILVLDNSEIVDCNFSNNSSRAWFTVMLHTDTSIFFKPRETELKFRRTSLPLEVGAIFQIKCRVRLSTRQSI